MERETIKTLIRILAEAEGLAPELCIKQCQAESSMNPAAVAPRGAIGLFQLMPATARQLHVDPHAWHQNVYGGIRYLARLKAAYGGDMHKALAAYNWGPGNLGRAITKHGAEWEAHLPAETRRYLSKILDPEAAA